VYLKFAFSWITLPFDHGAVKINLDLRPLMHPEDIAIDVSDLLKTKGLDPFIRKHDGLDFSKLDLDIKKGL